jgi:DNA-binding IclR family transcriptional regulator
MSSKKKPLSRPAKQNKVEAVLRGMSVLTAVLSSPYPMSHSEIALKTGLNRATTYRILLTLVESDYLSRTPNKPLYSPGLKILRHLPNTERFALIETKLVPVMQKLALLTGETVALFLPTWPDLVCKFAINSEQPIRRHHEVGGVSAMTSGATGRAFLSLMDPSYSEKTLLLRPLKGLAGNPPRSEKMFMKSLEIAKIQGLAISLSETNQGMNGVAIPLMSAEVSEPIGVISVSGPSIRWTEANITNFAPQFLKIISSVSTSDGGIIPTSIPMIAESRVS